MTWSDWSLEPGVVLGSVLAAALYLWVLRKLSVRPGPLALLFGLGLAVASADLMSPLAEGSRSLFVVHMAEHMLLIMLAAPLMALGVPPELVERLAAWPAGRAALRPVWSPAVGAVALNATLVVWHVPLLYEATLHSDILHDQEHLSMLLGAFLFWGAVLRTGQGVARGVTPRLVATAATVITNSLLGSFLFFAPRPLYASYGVAPRVWAGIDAGTDQALGAGLMWTMGDMTYLGLALWLVWTLLLGAEAEAVGGSQVPPALPSWRNGVVSHGAGELPGSVTGGGRAWGLSPRRLAFRGGGSVPEGAPIGFPTVLRRRDASRARVALVAACAAGIAPAPGMCARLGWLRSALSPPPPRWREGPGWLPGRQAGPRGSRGVGCRRWSPGPRCSGP